MAPANLNERAYSSVGLERTPDKREVGSSNLPRPTILRTEDSGIGTESETTLNVEPCACADGSASEQDSAVNLSRSPTPSLSPCDCVLVSGAVAQLGEHLLCKQGVVGSNPISSTNR